MPPERTTNNRRIPCPCTNCNGALRMPDTVRRHLKNNPPPWLNAPTVPSFSAWSAEQVAGAPGVTPTPLQPSQGNVPLPQPSLPQPASIPFGASMPGISSAGPVIPGLAQPAAAQPAPAPAFVQMPVQDQWNPQQPHEQQRDHRSSSPAAQQPTGSTGEDFGMGFDGHNDEPRAGSPPPSDDDEEDPEEEEEPATQPLDHNPLVQQQTPDEEDDHTPGAGQQNIPTPFQAPDDDEPLPPHLGNLNILKTTAGYVERLQAATLENGKMPENAIHRMRNPEPPPDIPEEREVLFMELFFALSNVPESVYEKVRQALNQFQPELEMPSLFVMRSRAESTTGIVVIPDNLCIGTCVAYTGPFEDLEKCPVCDEPRFNQDVLARTEEKVPRRQMWTFPIGPQIQAIRQSKRGLEALEYRARKVAQIIADLRSVTSADDIVYDDIFCGSAFLDLNDRLKLTQYDTVIGTSMDGAQLFAHKKGDTWIGVVIIHDYDPLLRFKRKRVLPAFVVGGESKPKSLDSCVFRTLHHLSAIQREDGGKGIKFYDGKSKEIKQSRIIAFTHTADALALVEWDGQAAACDHPDVEIQTLRTQNTDRYRTDLALVMSSKDQRTYEKNRKSTGICKPSIISGLYGPNTLPGTFKRNPKDKEEWPWATLIGEAWEHHGRLVAEATEFFPSSFHRPPRNPAEKINSGYKATEYFLYLFGLGPGFFRAILPAPYWKHFCRIVRVVRTMTQRRITGKQLKDTKTHADTAVLEYEHLYIQRKVERMHMGRPSIHTLIHAAQEGMIGLYTKQIRQTSNTFSHLAQIMRRYAETNALKAMYPQFDPSPPLPRYSLDTGGGFILLKPQSKASVAVGNANLTRHVELATGQCRVRKWGRLCLPNGQVARSVFQEERLVHRRPRITRNVKVSVNGQIGFGEVQFYFTCSDHGHLDANGNEIMAFKALLRMYSAPDQALLEESYGMLWAIDLQPDVIRVVNVTDILSVVSVQKLPFVDGDRPNRWFVVEKSGIDDIQLLGELDPLTEEECVEDYT
ncbi:hypothetical protein BKA70DRAFT_1574592 [Coprinopsis sp. MPI-PUGE-AT-0042]|nr:hypothetical protein BKA70DRAFT_1574592 [Coprinopsis sp. MPI-PUGE-AT-0042]